VDVDHLPNSEHEAAIERIEAHRTVAAIIRSLSGPERERYLVALEAMAHGSTKVEAADLGGMSRPTLDAMLRRLGERFRPD
jgi:hypothetical protein